jgi:neopullulanase
MPGAPSIYYGDEISMSGGHDPDCRRAFPWHEPESWDMDTLTQTKALVRLRLDLPALRYGGWQVVWQADEAFAYIRQHDGQRILVVICREQGVNELELPVESDTPALLWGEAAISAADGVMRVAGLAPWSGLIVRL